MNYLEEYKKWCESPEFDEETKKELLEIKDDEKEIEDRFYKELEFGTAGLTWSNWSRNKQNEQIHCRKSYTRTCKLYIRTRNTR